MKATIFVLIKNDFDRLSLFKFILNNKLLIFSYSHISMMLGSIYKISALDLDWLIISWFVIIALVINGIVLQIQSILYSFYFSTSRLISCLCNVNLIPSIVVSYIIGLINFKIIVAYVLFRVILVSSSAPLVYICCLIIMFGSLQIILNDLSSYTIKRRWTKNPYFNVHSSYF